MYHMKYFTIKNSFFLVPSCKCDEEFIKIDYFLEILEKSEVGKIIDSIHKINKNSLIGRKGYNPFNMFAMIVYCFSKYKSTLREMEELCIFDLRIIYIMEQQTPSYKVISEFINKYILPYQYEIFTSITKTIIYELNLNIENQYLDGTKLEANANKYKFVWEPTAYHKKLDIRIKELLLKMDIEFKDEKLIKSYQFSELIKSYVQRRNIDINSIPDGKGKRLTEEQRNYKIAYQHLTKLLDYEEKEEICGDNRNSYYKTDHDAKAMMLKEDYYSKLSHDFHAAYNFQALVSSGIITMYGVYQNRTDYYTFTPMLDSYYKYYEKYPKNICADSGYGIYTNYKYIKEHNIGNYVKFQSWKGESGGKNPQLFYAFDDGIMCLNTNIAKEIKFGNTHQRNKDGKLYKFTGCNSCNYSYKCKAKLKEENKNKDYRTIELIPEYELLKEQARKNLLSTKGIEIRVNRSIQVEGTFGQIKNNMGYVRIRRRGIEKVSCEIMLMCLGRNIRKLFTVLGDNIIKDNYWNTPCDLKPETFPFPKQKNKKNC